MAYTKSTTKVSVYDIVTEKIIALLKDGIIPWKKPSNRTPDENFTTKHVYEGINVLLTQYSRYSSPYWITFEKAKDIGGYVNAGEKGTPIFYWGFAEKDKKDENGNIIFDEEGKPVKEKYFFPRYYKVFNTEQCSIPEGKLPEIPVRTEITEADSVVKNFTDCPEIEYGNFDSPSYSDALDKIKMPVIENYDCEENYYAGLFKALVHATRNSKRLNRKEKAETYHAEAGYEELVAEIGSAFLCYECGIDTVILNQTAYIQKWLAALRENKQLVVYASGQAKKAVEWILRNNRETVCRGNY